jgi:flagellar biosynthesis regulator FlbT
MAKVVTVRISMNLNANVRIKVNGAVVKQVDRFVYLGNELWPERKTDNRSI